MSYSESFDVAIVGGGLGGLVSAQLLQKQGLSVILLEKKKYPFHRVCGEYISNEVIPFLKKYDLFPEDLKPSTINRFRMSSIAGKTLDMPLDLGGVGISRYAFDYWLVDKLKASGVKILDGCGVNGIKKYEEGFLIELADGRSLPCRLAIGAFGKRSSMDKKLQRPFIEKKSPYIGVKYHVRLDYPENLVALHNFQGGYCGINRIEGNKYNLCYLSRRDNLKRNGNIQAMEEAILFQNPRLKEIFRNSEFLFEKPETINEISFEKKGPLFDGIPMVGDAAGMITPLCGNGMAMAIHAAYLFAEIVKNNWDNGPNREVINQEYSKDWNNLFSIRLWAGRNIQKLFGGKKSSNLAVNLGNQTPFIARFLMAQTHGKSFV